MDDLGEKRLRKNRFSAWLIRWFLPGRERNDLGFESPEVASMDFVADDSDMSVRVKKSCIDPQTMYIKGYKPDDFDDKNGFIVLSDNDTIYVKKMDGSDLGHLVFHPGEAMDGNGYRIFVFLLLLVAIAAKVLVIITLLKSINLLS